MNGDAGEPLIKEPKGWINTHIITAKKIRYLIECLNRWDGEKFTDDVLQAIREQIGLPVFQHLAGSNPDNSPWPFTQALCDLVDVHSATVGILEEPYLDIECWVNNRKRPFLQHTMGCRIHFFKTSADDKAVLDMVNATDDETKIDGYYLGFLTLVSNRDSYSLGRSCILPPESNRGGYSCIKTMSSQYANVLMKTYYIDTVPYIQHVPRIQGNCATASIWIASNMLTPKFELSLMRYNQIAEYAGKSKPLKPREYLNVRQIVKVLSKIDTRPKYVQVLRDFLDKKKQQRVRRTLSRYATVFPVNRYSAVDQLYLYVESGLPVILGTHEDPHSKDGHAVVVVGHLQPEPPTSSPVPVGHAAVDFAYPDMVEIEGKNPKIKYDKGIPSALIRNHFLISQFYRDYLVHDEARGPFRHFHVEPFNDSNADYHCACRIDVGKPSQKLVDLQTMIVPLPPIGDAEPSQILSSAICMFHDTPLAHDADGKVISAGDYMMKHRVPSVLWRIVLTHEIEFKQSLGSRHVPADIINEYRNIHFPRFIYVVEFTICNQAQMHGLVHAGRERTVTGEFIYDTTTLHQFEPLSRRSLGNIISPAKKKWIRSAAPIDDIKKITCYCGPPLKHEK